MTLVRCHWLLTNVISLTYSVFKIINFVNVLRHIFDVLCLKKNFKRLNFTIKKIIKKLIRRINKSNFIFSKKQKIKKKKFNLKDRFVAEGSFDLPTSGLWAQHASSAPLCWKLKVCVLFFIFQILKLNYFSFLVKR